jgi:hypothetical protein
MNIVRQSPQRVASFLIVFWAAALSSGCDRERTGSTRDGNAGGAPSAAGRWQMDGVEGTYDFVAGHDDTRAGHVLHRVGRVFPIGNQGIAVVHRGGGEILIFEESGEVRHSLGASGAGPGEFLHLEDAWAIGSDSIAAWDPVLRRLSWWSATGENLGSITIETEGQPHVVGAFRDGSFVVLERPVHARMRPGETWLGRAAALRMDPDGTLSDTIAVLDWEVVHAVQNPLGAGSLYTRGRFDPVPIHATHDSVFYYAWGADFEIAMYSGRGESVGAFRRDAQPRPVTGELVQRWIDDHLSRASEADRPIARRAVESLPTPTHLPAHDMLFVDASGRGWAREFCRTGDDACTWFIFSPDGTLVGRVALPASFRATWADERRILGVVEAENDVEVVAFIRDYRMH